MHASHVAATRKGKKPGGGSPRSPRAGGDSDKKQRKVKGWAAIGEGCWVLGGRGVEVDGDLLTPSAVIVSGTVFARVVPSSSLDVGIHTSGSDSVRW